MMLSLVAHNAMHAADKDNSHNYLKDTIEGLCQSFKEKNGTKLALGVALLPFMATAQVAKLEWHPDRDRDILDMDKQAMEYQDPEFQELIKKRFEERYTRNSLKAFIVPGFGALVGILLHGSLPAIATGLLVGSFCNYIARDLLKVSASLTHETDAKSYHVSGDELITAGYMHVTMAAAACSGLLFLKRLIRK